MSEGKFTYDVFLSHNSQDKPRVRRLAERLKAAGVQMEAGLRLWLDELVIPKSDLHPCTRAAGSSRSCWDCALPDTLRRYKVVDFREEFEAAFAKRWPPVKGQRQRRLIATFIHHFALAA